MSEAKQNSLYRKGLNNAGLRVTQPRLRILRILERASEKGEHLSAEDVYRKMLASEKSAAGIATVYRVLAQFEDAGLINRLDFNSGHARFELERGKHHDHMVCLESGAVTEFCNQKIEALQEEIAKKHGYELVDHRLVLFVRPLPPKKE